MTWEQIPPDGVRVARIRVYPLKGAGGVDLQKADLDDLGIPGDRRWMLVRPNGLFISQRTHPRLALVRMEGWRPEDPSGPFRVKAPGMGPLVLGAAPAVAPLMGVQVHRDHLQGRVMEEEGRWFSAFFREEVRLVYFGSEILRPVDPERAPGHRTAFSDGYPLLLTSQESLDDLNGHLSTPSRMSRFRPNLVVRGCRPWEEDRWRTLSIGNARVELVKPCARCVVTTVDQRTGVRGTEPLRTLARVRGWEGKNWFGQNGVVARSGSFRVGDVVGIVEEGEALPPLSMERGEGS